jgi:2-polyprenyl-6-methoxyphenol hydroxylase-like FAD-dependent oxidoreductase
MNNRPITSNDDAPGAQLGRRAVVLGASIAGLLAARVLSERFEEVWLLERDPLPQQPQARKGTPQVLQPHGLLARGRIVFEELFPGLTQQLMGAGALGGDLQTHVSFVVEGKALAGGKCGYFGLAVSRLMLEHAVRERVLALANVTAICNVDVRAPRHEYGTVTGVLFEYRDRQEAMQTVAADLVVDCTGRASRAPRWLEQWGYEPVIEDRVRIDLAYVSAYFERDAAYMDQHVAAICAVTPAAPYPGVLIAQEPGSDGCARWVAGVGGFGNDQPAASLQGMLQQAKQIGHAPLTEILQTSRMLGEPIRYGFPYSMRRRYERLERFPEQFLILGDAIASFNPIYGQGMTVAACEALALREALATKGLHALAPRFFKQAAKIVDIPWQLAVGSDLALPHVEGHRSLGLKLINRYISRLYRAAQRDPVVAGAFLKVVHLVTAPATLFNPRIVWRVIRKGSTAAIETLAVAQPTIAPARGVRS